jgi:hypothetical protein
MNLSDIYALIARDYYAREEARKNGIIVVRQAKVRELEIVVQPHFQKNTLNSKFQIGLPYAGRTMRDIEIGLNCTKNVSYS